MTEKSPHRKGRSNTHVFQHPPENTSNQRITEKINEKKEKPGDRVFTLLDQLERAVDQLIEQLTGQKKQCLDRGEHFKEAAE